MFDFLEEPFDFELFSETRTKKRIIFDIEKSFEKLKISIGKPKKGEELRMISPAKGFSSCSVLMWLLQDEVCKDLLITTLRVGKKEMDALCEKINEGQIKHTKIILSGIAKENGSYNYDKIFEQKAKANNIDYEYINNHSKVMLLDCGGNKYVVETSSNFNENPKIEQFIVSNSKKIYDYYISVFKKIGLIE